MDVLERGDIVSAQFVFTDVSQTKIRPAVLIAVLTEHNFLLCPITRRNRPGDPYQIELKQHEILEGNLRADSFIRPNLLMCVHRSLIYRKIGKLPVEKMNRVVRTLAAGIGA